MVFIKHVLVICAWLQAAAINSSICSEQACEGDDGAAYLQRFSKESSASLAGLETTGNCFDIQNGECEGTSGGTARCTVCDPNTGTNETIPGSSSGNIRFPNGKLACGPETQCESQNSPSDGDPYDFWDFKDANDYIVCAGKTVCSNSWRVQNVGAVCCSGEQSCNTDFVAIFGTSVPDGEPAATCNNDVCCDGNSVCVGSSGTSGGVPTTQFIDARSMSCRGIQTCKQVWATLSKDLYCSQYSGVLGGDGNDVCSSSSNIFTFFSSETNPTHCVSCLGENDDANGVICKDSTFNFNSANANVKMICDSKDGCQAAKVNIADPGTCLELNCKGPTFSGSQVCKGLIVTYPNAGTSPSTQQCKCTGDEDLCNQISGNLPADQSPEGKPCPYDASHSCGANICDDPSTCCDGLSATASSSSSNSPPQCNSNKCGCTAPTTSTTTTTTTTTPGGDLPSSTSTAGEVGDPHIDTFDGQHYTLLKQGSFSFWRFAGSDAEIFSAKNSVKKLPVDFKIYTHYSGHTSYTKGLLLVDSSGATTPQRALELTSKDCTWRTKTKDTEWSAVEKPQLLSIPDADGDEMTAFRMMKPLHRQKMYVELLMKKADGGFKKIGNLYARCKPGHHINMKIAMSSKEDIGLVQGQVGIHGHTAAGEDHKASLLQGTQRMRSDSEFAISEKWTDLGGSGAAATYLSMVDEEGPAAFLKDCTGQERIEAKAMCKKYLGEPPTRSGDLHSFENRFDNCVFDVCNGGGEVAAEMAAEIFHAE